MKKSIAFCAAWACGYMINASQPYLKMLQTFKQEEDSHSFQEFIQNENYSQPKIIDFLHSSPERHFLHNMIVQNEKAFNFFKVYLPRDVDMISSENNHHLHVVFNAADEVRGNNNDVNSGLLATLIDNAFGQLSFLATGFIPSVTANLQLNLNKTIHTNKDYLISCEVEKVQGRKVFLKAIVYDNDKNICGEATALFITVNWGGKQWKQAIETLQNTRFFNEGIQRLLY
ncbi:unnamed protein product (macronuclear) [Paramecium tetraurelia]|uniref:Acyl-coenzyme A thioesterase THEM4 n=1 Tax=Paramecium tetraurelia TaxID=5888 RepID=A0DUY2_PARTE|nr:uncharacterized protein GSPATT00020511001 [Paramecium tetraurelia]CAK86849.1 unnamed protein product [Paramecium tetraurelia]|eukprot:XP_001454246.1 hypothetical protein (macronuclear) [Paramecium tetraurelia strain d4-2]